jgi:hypothetical protein
LQINTTLYLFHEMTEQEASARIQRVLNYHQCLLAIPALAAPAEVAPNFVDPPNLKAPLLELIGSGYVLASIAVWMQLFTQFRIVRNVGPEDCKRRPFSRYGGSAITTPPRMATSLT